MSGICSCRAESTQQPCRLRVPPSEPRARSAIRISRYANFWMEGALKTSASNPMRAARVAAAFARSIVSSKRTACSVSGSTCN